MKVIKIILGVIILLSLVFFGTGLVVKEVQYTAEITTDKPIKEVFSTFSDIKNQKKWLPEITEIEVVNNNPQKIGSIYKLKIDNQGQEVAMKQKVLAYIPNEKITYRFNSDVLVRTEDYLFSEVGNHTKITQKTSIRALSYMLACTFPWFKSKFKEGSQQNLEKFKTITEKQ